MFDSPASAHLSLQSKNVIYEHCQSRDFALHDFINEAVKWLTSLAHRNAEIILVVTFNHLFGFKVL